MRFSRYLVVAKSKQIGTARVRLTLSRPTLKGNEIAIHINVDIPNELFTKPQLKASITIPKNAVSAPTIDVEVIDNIQKVISHELGIALDISVPEIDPEPTQPND